MGVCSSNKNKIPEAHQYLKLVKKASVSLANRASVCHEVGIIVIGFIRQMMKIHQTNDKIDVNVLILLRSDIKHLCALYCGSTAADLVVENGSVLTLRNLKQRRLEYNSILIKKNATLTVSRWNRPQSHGGRLDILCYGNITLEEGASINLNGKGYHGGMHGRNGESYGTHSKSVKSRKNNFGGGGGAKMSLSGEYGASTSYGGGGAYGSVAPNAQKQCGKKGNNGSDGSAGAIYGDSMLRTLHLGSGGGSGYRFKAMDNSLRAEKGGAGGGALKLQCLGSIVMKDGSKICCDGKSGGGRGIAGGGSGGSVRIILNDADALQMEENSTISAIGGMNQSNCGNGGNGRIRMQFLAQNAGSYYLHNLCDITPKPWIG